MLSAMVTRISEPAVTLMRAALRINAQARRRARTLPALFFVTDEARIPDPVPVALRLPRGTGIIFRHYRAPDRAMLARRLAVIARARGLVLLIAADPALARQVGAQGVHWPEALMHRASGRRRGVTTVAAHDGKALIRARMRGADAALLSPVFATRSGAEKRPLGLLRFAALVHAARLPVYALGGISSVTAKRLLRSGATGFAAIEAFISGS